MADATATAQPKGRARPKGQAQAKAQPKAEGRAQAKPKRQSKATGPASGPVEVEESYKLSDAAPPKRNRGGRPLTGAVPRIPVIALRGAPAWKEWVLRFSAHSRIPLPDLVDRALIQLARVEGFEEPAPRR